jgi:superfamily II DNA or RNA helicase
VVVGMVQTMAGSWPAKPPAPGRRFGLCIVDEAHHMPTASLVAALEKVSAHRHLGLTATPERADGLERFVYAYLGPVCFRAERPPDPHVKTILVDVTKRIAEVTHRGGQPGTNRMIMGLCTDAVRNQVLFRLLVGVTHKYPARKVLVLSDRVTHLRALAELLGSRLTSIYVSKQRDPDAFQTPITLSTYAMAAEGLDRPELSVLVLATPRSRVQQPVGRVLRGDSSVTLPIVVDLCDRWSLFAGMALKREAYYRSSKYTLVRMHDEDVLADSKIAEAANLLTTCNATRAWLQEGGGVSEDPAAEAAPPEAKADREAAKAKLGARRKVLVDDYRRMVVVGAKRARVIEDMREN